MRLGLDIGTNSIGWWLYQTDNTGRITDHIDGGVRLFGDGRHPKSGESLAVARRTARQDRKRRDRYLRRRSDLMTALAMAGLMPESPQDRKALESQDPYALRAAGLHERLELHEFGRALFHLNQRRGFKSNRKTDGKDNEGGKIKDGAARLDVAMMTSGAKTYGEFLNKRLTENPSQPIRTRLGVVTSSDGKESQGYSFYPTRALFEKEFQELWETQSEFYPGILTNELRDKIWQIIFFQRPLKAPKVGKCLFEDETRLAKAHPLFQELRLYQTVNALRLRDDEGNERSITLDERNSLILAARQVRKLSFAKMRKTITAKQTERFTLENSNRKDIDGHEVEAVMRKAYGNKWITLDEDQQWSIIKVIKDTEDAEALTERLVNEFGLPLETVNELLRIKLPDGYGRLSKTASRKILDLLKQDVTLYSDAASQIYGSHSDDRTGEVFDALPYYGEILQRHVIPGSMHQSLHDPVKHAAEYWGRITNPTVHIGLNQLRQLVNDIIAVYGKPNRIVVELARDLKHSDAQKKEINAGIKKATAEAERRSKKLEELNIKDTGEARMRLRLWEESHPDAAKRNCPYCTRPIGVRQAVDGTETQIDHILPYSRTLDDTPTNKVLCHSVCNQEKRNKTPYEAWGHTDKWLDIVTNLKNLPPNKAKRFGADALLNFEGDRSFESRQLVDTQYLSRIARTYLSRLYPDPDTAPVQVIPGKMTEMLRRKWDLNELLNDAEHHNTSKEKNRQDHRHHAIDAAVIAATDTGLLQKISRAAARNEDNGRNAVVATEPPFNEFRSGLKAILDDMTVSHKPDHGTVGKGMTSGQLHNDTAYGLLPDGFVVTRKPFDTLKAADLEKLCDEHLKNLIMAHTKGLDGKEFTQALEHFARTNPHYRNIRRVRLKERLSIIPILDKNGKPYKGYKGDSNHCVEVWRMPDGKWKSCVLTTFEANKFGLGHTRPHPAAKLLMRLFNKDSVALDHPKFGAMVTSIAKMSVDRIYLFPHNEANVDARARSKTDPFNYINVGLGTFQNYKLRKIGIDRLGRVSDPGPYKS